MPGAPEFLDLSTEHGKLRFAVYASAKAADCVEALRATGRWADERGDYSRHALLEWMRDHAQIAFIVAPPQIDVARKIWFDVFDCAWESARSSDGEMGDQVKDESFRRAARRRYGVDGQLEFDDDAAVDRADGGAYVQCWCWVYADDVYLR